MGTEGSGVDRACGESSQEKAEQRPEQKAQESYEAVRKVLEQGATGSVSGPSGLETRAVTPVCAKQYRTFYAEFLDFCVTRDFGVQPPSAWTSGWSLSSQICSSRDESRARA